MQQPWVSIDLEADPHAAKVLTSTHAPTPWPEVGLLAAQSELRLQLLPALEARHTSESAALFRGHKLDRESLDRRYDEDSAEMEARHHNERAALVDTYRAGRDVLGKQFAADNADMQSKQLSETQAFLQQNLDLHRDMIAALAQQRKHQQEESDSLAAEKASMEAPGISGGDILQLNVGGESFVVTRGTLTQAKDSLLASKFNGRWEARHQLDNQGQIFLDYDPYCFKQVLAYLRSKAIERPDRPAPQPIIAPESQAQFNALLQFLGLEVFMGRHFFFDKCSNGASMTEIRTVLQKHTAAGIDESCLLAPAMPYGKTKQAGAAKPDPCACFCTRRDCLAFLQLVLPAVLKSSERLRQEGQTSVSNTVPGASSSVTLQQGAQAATSWMFPWEKRQMDGRGTPLRTWEKLYWGIFVTAISLFLFNRLKPDPVEAKIDEDKEARKLEAARAVLAGRSFTEGEEDPFEGLGPQEIQAYIDKALDGVSHSDPFEGMTPEEINDYTAKNGIPAQYQ
ncbi:hypothetical protein WJX79_009640 [Trebouxia sp. C0005]